MANVSPENLEKYLKNCLIRAVDQAAKKTVEYLVEYIQRNWYDKYSPESYKRTFDFIRSASKTDATFTGKNEVTSMIYFDVSKIKARYYGPGKLNAHAGFDGASTAEMIPAWIERGHDFIGRGYEKLGSLEATITMLEKNFPRMVQRELKKMGLKVQIAKE